MQDDEFNTELLQIAIRYKERYEKFTKDTEGESILQIILRAHLYIEYELRKILRANLQYPELLEDKLRFSDIVNIVFSMGLIPIEEMAVIKKINNLRNTYAHNLNFTITEEEIKKLIDSMSPSKRMRFERQKSTNIIDQLRDILFWVWTDLYEYTLIPHHVKEQLGIKFFE